MMGVVTALCFIQKLPQRSAFLPPSRFDVLYFPQSVYNAFKHLQLAPDPFVFLFHLSSRISVDYIVKKVLISNSRFGILE
jgi:hypothetical protein